MNQETMKTSPINLAFSKTPIFSSPHARLRFSAVLRLWLAALIGLGLVGGAGQSAQAAYPERPIRILVGFSPGGAVDILARLIGEQLSRKLGQPVLVENRAGANATIAAEAVARAAPDGYTLLMNSQSHTLAAATMKIPFDPVRSFAPITIVARVPNLLVVNPKFINAGNTREFIALARSKPGELNYGHAGTADPTFVNMALLINQAGIRMTDIPYKGIADAQAALLSGQIQVAFGSIATFEGQIKAGTLKALAISSKTRAPSLPEVPSVAESAGLPNYDMAAWFGMLATAGTPTDILYLLHRNIVEITNGPEMAKTFIARGFIKEVSKSPEEFTEFVRKDFEEITSVLGPLKVAN